MTFVLGGMPLNSAIADDNKVEALEECPRLVESNGIEYCQLSLEDWKTVLRVGVSLEATSVLLEREKTKVEALETQKTALQKSLAAMADSQKILVVRVDKLTDDHNELDKKYQNERVKPRLGNPLAWTITAAAVALVTGFIVKEALD